MLAKSVRGNINEFRVHETVYFSAWLVWAWGPLSENVSFTVVFFAFSEEMCVSRARETTLA